MRKPIKYEGGPVLADKGGENFEYFASLDEYLNEDGDADGTVYVAHAAAVGFNLRNLIENREPPDGFGEIQCSAEDVKAFEKTVNEWLKKNVSTWYEAGGTIDVAEYVARKAAGVKS